MIIKDKILERAKSAKRESKRIEYKERFDVSSHRDWCEILKDIVAMANSGGGGLLIGVTNNGMPSGFDVTPVLNLDPAKLTDKIAKYTGVQFSDFEIMEIEKDGHEVAVFVIYDARTPMIFTEEGIYDALYGKPKKAFRKGTIYFRHGAKSEPGISDDLREVVEREVERTRKSWLDNIKKVVSAPPGYGVQVPPPDVSISTAPKTLPVRIVDEQSAPAYKLETPDTLHPYRQKEVIQIFNERLKGRKSINSYDILSIRRVYKIDKTKPQYHYKSKYGARQYSDDFVEWLVKSYEDNPSFFDDVRKKHFLMRQGKKILTILTK